MSPEQKWSIPCAGRIGAALRVHLPIEPVGPNGRGGLLRSGWMARGRAKKKIRDMLALALSTTTHAPTLERAKVFYVRSYRSRPLDPDNMVASIKPVLDALQDLGVIRTDAHGSLDLRVQQEPRGGRGPFMQLTIEPWKE